MTVLLPRSMRAVIFGLGLMLFLAGGTATSLVAHDDRPAPLVTVRIVPNGTQLDIVAHVPSRALPIPNLPRDAAGRLRGEGLAEPLRLVARDFINSLELQQDGEPLPSPTSAATVVEGGDAVQITLGYLIRSGVGRLGVRLAPFRGQLDLVAVEAEYVDAGAPPRRYRVSDAPERILLAPSASDAARGFLTRGARLLFTNRELLLFVLGLALPLTAFEATRRRDLATLMAAQLLGSVVGLVGLAGGPSVAPLALAIAASTTLVAMVQTVASLAVEIAGPIWGGNAHPTDPVLDGNGHLHHARSTRTALVAVFGLAAGVALGTRLSETVQFAGGHTMLAFAAAMTVVLLGQWWAFSVAVIGLRLAGRAGVSSQILIVASLIYIGHEAMHAVARHLFPVAGQIGTRPDYLVEALTLLWILTVVGIGAFDRRARA
jgi:hypothetical protein